MTRRVAILVAATLCLCGAAIPAGAHHSYGMFYDLCRTVTIEGHIQSIEWKNPHVMLDVETDDGAGYRVEWTGIQNLTRNGVASDALAPGDRVVITGSPMKDGARVVSALTQIRRARDGWRWSRDNPSPPPECAGK